MRRGRLTLPLLYMHGVPEHHYTLYAGRDGAGWRAIEIEPRTTGAITVTLGGGAYANECDDGDRARFGGGSPVDGGVAPAPSTR